MQAVKPDDVLLLVCHPHGDVWVSLAEWIANGPGPRFRLHPTTAKHAKDGAPLQLHEVVAIEYRNDAESRALIIEGKLADPWSTLREAWGDRLDRAEEAQVQQALARFAGSRVTR